MSYMLAVLAVSAVTHCQARSIGPGSLQRGGTAGAACLLSSFQNGCRASEYTLSAFGVDTEHSLTFRVGRASGRCTVAVSETFRVVPQPPHQGRRYACLRVRRTAADIVADRCTPRATVSLTKLGTT